jgi:putative transposase
VAKRAAALRLRDRFPEASLRHASRVVGLSSGTLYYRPKDRGDGPIESRMKELAERFRRYGRPRMHVLLKREGLVQNPKKTARIYRKIRLQLGNRKRKKMSNVIRIPRPKASRPNEVWSMDFVFDVLLSRRRIKIWPVVDDYTKRCVSIVVARGITGQDLVDQFERMPVLPKRIRSDNGPEFQSRALLNWIGSKNGAIEHEFIQPGKPIQNAYIESFNSRIRDECLNENVFVDIEDARQKIQAWLDEYHSVRPHSSLGMKTPEEFEKSLGSG